MTYGDFVLLLPFLAELRRLYAAARITILCGRRGSRLCELYPMVNEVVNLGRVTSASQCLTTARRLISLFRSDIVFALHPIFDAGMLAFFLAGRQRIGFHNADVRLFDGEKMTLRTTVSRFRAWLLRKILLTESQPMKIGDTHAVNRFLQLLIPPGHPRPSLQGQLSSQYPRKAGESPLIVLAPFSGWTPRNWPLERWVQLARLIISEKKGSRVLVSTDPSSSALAKEAFASVAGAELFNPGDDFDLLFRTFATADLIVSNDSFPLHAASALNVPSIGLFGPNVPRWFGGLSEMHEDLFEEIECSPCMQQQGREPCLRGFATCAALTAWSAESVAERCVALLHRSRLVSL